VITKFNLFESMQTSGVVSIKIGGKLMYFHLKYNENKTPFRVELWLNTGKYQNLSIEIPDSKKLDRKEFYLNPDINIEIINTLKDEGFVEESGKQSIAGDEKTKSYTLLI